MTATRRGLLATTSFVSCAILAACHPIDHDLEDPQPHGEEGGPNPGEPSDHGSSDPPQSSDKDATTDPQPRPHGRGRRSGGRGTLDGSQASKSTESKLATQFVAAHNRHRQDVNPAAHPPLPTVRWSAKLAAHAESVAASCAFDHSETNYGENLFAATSDNVSAEEIVGSWAAEAANWNHKAGTCAASQICGHYTQVVWRDSTEIGCAIRTCDRQSPFGSGSWTFAVCNYNPPGNFNGARPY